MGLWAGSFGLLRVWARQLSFDPRCTGQIGKLPGQILNNGSFLLLIQIPRFTDVSRLETHLREPIPKTSDAWSWVRNSFALVNLSRISSQDGTLFPQILLGSMSQKIGSPLV